MYEMANRRGPGYTNTGHGTGGVASAGPPGVRGGSGLLGHCWHLASPQAVRAVLLFGPSSLAVLFGSTVDTFYVSLQRLVGGAVLGQRCARFSLCNDRCRVVRTFLLWRRGSSP